MLSKSAANVILAKVRAMYGRRISTKNYEDLVSYNSVSEIAGYLKNSTGYSLILSNINERDIHRGKLESLIRTKLFLDLESLGRYEISTGDSFAQYITVRTEIDEIIHSLMYILSGKPKDYIYSLPMFFERRTKINLLKLAEAKDYDDFLEVLKGSPYYKLLVPFNPNGNEMVNMSAVEETLYNYLYKTFFEAIDKSASKRVKNELENLVKIYIDYNNFVRIVRLKRNKNKANFAVIKNGSLKDKYINAMLLAKDEDEVFEIMRKTNPGKKMEKVNYNYIDELPVKVLYQGCRKRIRYSDYPSVVMMSYIFLVQIEISNLVTIIEGVRYGMPKDDIKNLLILKN